ncbi:MAG TPA: hypothetical protein PLL10_10885, partial [Elusimicrobiales bacterium]|nr:hypothetical protein [Elusimicrobiales bacterium]
MNAKNPILSAALFAAAFSVCAGQEPLPPSSCLAIGQLSEDSKRTLEAALEPGAKTGPEAESAKVQLLTLLRCQAVNKHPLDRAAAGALCKAWALDLNPSVPADEAETLCADFPSAIGRLQELAFKNRPKAIEHYIKAAAAGDQWAMTRLGIIYAAGVGVQPDYVKAAGLFG